jgi:hypothetical protein
MAMVIHPRNEYEKAFTEGIYEGLKKKGISRIGYAKQDLYIKRENLSLTVAKGDLIALAENKQQRDLLFELYKEIRNNQNYGRSLPQITYIDSLILVLSKLLNS